MALTERYARLINDAIKDRPTGMTVGIHLCRGNFKGAWMAEGGYEPVADVLFNGTNVDAYFLEYDTPRAGDFTPLRFVPKNKTVVLGLISTKTPQLELKGRHQAPYRRGGPVRFPRTALPLPPMRLLQRSRRRSSPDDGRHATQDRVDAVHRRRCLGT